MKRILAYSSAVLLASCLSGSASAGHVAETLTLSAGWNAVYLESTPDTPAPSDFFAELPQVEHVSLYESSSFGATEQIASDGSSIDQKPVAFLVWVKGNPDGSTLKSMRGGRCYLIYTTEAATKTFYGVPAQPRTNWQVSDGGFATLAGVSIPAGESVQSGAYFKEGPVDVDSMKSPCEAGGTDLAAPEFTPLVSFTGMPKVSGGRAYALEGKRAAEWAGVVGVAVPSLSGAIAFTSGSSLQAFTISNNGTTNRTIRVAYGPSELAGETQPPLQVHLPREGTNAAHWATFATHDFALAPGQARTLTLAADKSALSTNLTYAALITVSDLSGTKMRVRVPVTVSADADSEYSAAFPKGLWCGNVTLSQVDRLSDGNPIPSGGEMKASAIVFVDSSGAAHLMQRVAVVTADEQAEDGSRDVKLMPDAVGVPSGYSARRISAVFPDVAHRSLDATSGAFGEMLQFDWTVAADARDNPFRHAWHPDHATGFAVTNRLALAWRTESGESTFAYDPNEVTYGICTWTLGGLSGTGDIKMRGTFALKRILPVSKVERQ